MAVKYGLDVVAPCAVDAAEALAEELLSPLLRSVHGAAAERIMVRCEWVFLNFGGKGWWLYVRAGICPDISRELQRKAQSSSLCMESCNLAVVSLLLK